jgi:hypothetical protein
MAAHTFVSTQTSHHIITITPDGHLTVVGDSNSFMPEETQQLLEVLLIWQYGLEEVSSDETPK